MLHSPLLKTACITLLCLSSILPQSLYNSDFQHYHIINRESREIFVEDTLANLMERTFKLEECNSRQNSTVRAYSELLRMLNKRILPNDNTIDELCKKQPHLVMRSPDDCHRYYNCSGEDSQLTTWFYQFGFWPAKHKHECHYPFLYSEETMQCENYTKVNCGTRKEPTWACRYFRLQCKLSHCPPCGASYPKCEGKRNGLYIALESGLTNRYKICKDGRPVHVGHCNGDKIWGGQTFPYNGKCTHIYALPTDFFDVGRLPSCKGQLNGNYQFPDRPCDAYYRCEDGVSSPVKCPTNTVFDSVTKTCKEGGKCFV